MTTINDLMEELKEAQVMRMEVERTHYDDMDTMFGYMTAKELKDQAREKAEERIRNIIRQIMDMKSMAEWEEQNNVAQGY